MLVNILEGINKDSVDINEAYIDQDRKKIIATNVKSAMTKAPIKFKATLSVRDSRMLILKIKSTKLLESRRDALENLNKTRIVQGYQNMLNDVNKVLSGARDMPIQINGVIDKDTWTPDGFRTMKLIEDAIMSTGYYDNSDAMIDYFDVDFYYKMEISKG